MVYKSITPINKKIFSYIPYAYFIPYLFCKSSYIQLYIHTYIHPPVDIVLVTFINFYLSQLCVQRATIEEHVQHPTPVGVLVDGLEVPVTQVTIYNFVQLHFIYGLASYIIIGGDLHLHNSLLYMHIFQLIAISYISRLTVVSREAKKKQHACVSSGPCDHYCELFTRMAALKFESAVTQLLQQCCLLNYKPTQQLLTEYNQQPKVGMNRPTCS